MGWIDNWTWLAHLTLASVQSCALLLAVQYQVGPPSHEPLEGHMCFQLLGLTVVWAQNLVPSHVHVRTKSIKRRVRMGAAFLD